MFDMLGNLNLKIKNTHVSIHVISKIKYCTSNSDLQNLINTLHT